MIPTKSADELDEYPLPGDVWRYDPIFSPAPCVIQVLTIRASRKQADCRHTATQEVTTWHWPTIRFSLVYRPITDLEKLIWGVGW